MKNLECRNAGTDWGDRREQEIWERMSQRENHPEKAGRDSVTYFGDIQMVLACFRIWAFPEKPAHAQQKVSCCLSTASRPSVPSPGWLAPRSCRWVPICSWRSNPGSPGLRRLMWSVSLPKAARPVQNLSPRPEKESESPGQGNDMKWEAWSCTCDTSKEILELNLSLSAGRELDDFHYPSTFPGD